MRETALVQQLVAGTLEVEWVSARLVSDDPDKVLHPPERREMQMGPRLQAAMGRPSSEMDLVSPYFVPTQEGTDALVAIAARGVKVRVLTNSLAATDVAPVYAGYVKYREALLRGGVRLFELKPQSDERPHGKFRAGSAASLHAKTFAIDRSRIFIGSFNLDPRSARLNTEVGVVLESPTLATQLSEAFDRSIPSRAYEVRLTSDGKGVEWIEQTAAGEVRHSSTPGASASRMFFVNLLRHPADRVAALAPGRRTARPDMPIVPDSRSAGSVWRFDVVAGLTAAAVVLPKAMAYAAVAGLPVAVGLYTAFIPMIVYALLGTSRVLSVSSTTTLAILAGTELALVVPDGDPARLVTATATLTALVGVMLLVARLMRLGFVADFISAPVLTGFKAGIGLVIVLDQVPKLLGIHITKQGFFPDLLSVAQHVPETSLLTLAVAVATLVILVAMERLWPHSPAPLAAVGVGIAAAWCLGLEALGVSIVGHIPQGLASITLPDLSLAVQLLPAAAGIALMSFTETIAAGRAFARPGDPPVDANRELVAVGCEQSRGSAVGRDAVGRRNVADGGRPRGGRPHAEGVARHRGRRARDHALPGAAARTAAECHAGDDRHRLLDRPDPARRIHRHPQGADDGVSLGRGRRARRASVRDAAGDPGGDHRVADQPVEPGHAARGARHRAQARRRRPAAGLARAPRRRDVRGPVDPSTRGAPVLRERAERRRSGQGADAGAPAARAGTRLQPGARHRVLGAADAHREREAGDGAGRRRSGSRDSIPACSRSCAARGSTSSWARSA